MTNGKDTLDVYSSVGRKRNTDVTIARSLIIRVGFRRKRGIETDIRKNTSFLSFSSLRSVLSDLFAVDSPFVVKHCAENTEQNKFYYRFESTLPSMTRHSQIETNTTEGEQSFSYQPSFSCSHVFTQNSCTADQTSVFVHFSCEI